jgi:hypothetical protein
MSQIETLRTCSRCQNQAIAAVCVQKGQLAQKRVGKYRDMTIGRGVGSHWIVVCEEHAKDYPDYEVFMLGGPHETD